MSGDKKRKGKEILSKIKCERSPLEVAELLRHLAEQVEAGHVKLDPQGETTLPLPERVELELEIKRKRKGDARPRNKVEVELAWTEPPEESQG